jgi:hypothetical protein
VAVQVPPELVEVKMGPAAAELGERSAPAPTAAANFDPSGDEATANQLVGGALVGAHDPPEFVEI